MIGVQGPVVQSIISLTNDELVYCCSFGIFKHIDSIAAKM